MWVFGLGVIVFWLAAIGGWINNIVILIGSLGDPTVTPMFVARCVGVIFAPLGAVLGYV